MTYAALLATATRALAETLQLDAVDARLEALLFLCHGFGISRAQVLSRLRDAAPSSDAFESLLARRLSGEPVAYILGEREFYGLALQVNPAVLIPRPETELLVDTALTLKPQRILEIGTGSGAIAIALAHSLPDASIIATDVSQAALEVARRNGTHHQTANIEWILSDGYAQIPTQQFDLIVSNPPYVEANDECINSGDLRFEPQLALSGGADGLDVIRMIVAGAPDFLAPDGWLMFEHGYNHGARVRELLASRFDSIETLCDLAGHERVTLGRLASR